MTNELNYNATRTRKCGTGTPKSNMYHIVQNEHHIVFFAVVHSFSKNKCVYCKSRKVSQLVCNVIIG